MRKISLATIAGLAALLIHTAAASAYQYSISDPYHRLSPTTTTKIERAVSFQVNRQVQPAWPLNPVSFIPAGGFVIHILPQAAVDIACEQPAGGCHAWNDIYVSASDTTPLVEYSISHEVIEAETDRSGLDGASEICDAAEIAYQGLGGVWLNDFTLPTGRDFLKALRARRR